MHFVLSENKKEGEPENNNKLMPLNVRQTSEQADIHVFREL